MLRALVVLVVLALTTASGARPARACAPAPRHGEIVRIADEEALIAWDAANKVQHFVRRATFFSSGDAFGFLVPTPTKPELGEVDGALFDQLVRHLQPRIVYEDGGLDLQPGCSAFVFMRGAAPESAMAGSSVRVLDAQRVAGFDAVVLAADDPAALASWLKERSFAEGPTLTDWLAPYVKEKWIITAFKVADPKAGAGTGAPLGTSSVRMSFATDRPFYPYREPADQRETIPAGHKVAAPPSRTLRVYFASDARYEGALGDGGKFPGKVELAERVDAPEQMSGFFPGPVFLTVFDDKSNPRPGTADVFFTRASDQATVSVPPIVIRERREVPIPLDLIGLAVMGGVGIVVLIRRRRRKSR